MAETNGLVCFTNCLLPQEDGTLVKKDLWIDERRGVIVDAQRTFFERKERPDRTIDLSGNILSPGLIDVQLNGAYGFDFSVYDGDDDTYKRGLQLVAERIVETGVTSLLPTVITQEKSLYPKLLDLLRPFSTPISANLLGWHAEGPFIEHEKRGAHAPPFLQVAHNGFKSLEDVYGADNLTYGEDWLLSASGQAGVRLITAAPELEGVMDSIKELTKRGVIFSIGHSVASSDVATMAVNNGARLITHLFNAMPQLHHRDPSIIGLLGASPYLESIFTPITAIAEPVSPVLSPSDTPEPLEAPGTPVRPAPGFVRPFYGMIVDGIHCHPNSVRLAYSSFPDGCILVTDAQKILDPHLKDGIHEWRDGVRFVKEGDKLYLEGTNTLAGSVITLDKCIRNFISFTGCSIGEALKCATYNPAKCLGIHDRKGTLRPGADADLVVMNKDGSVLATWVHGRQVWANA